jgi:hypothetical protein
MLSFLAADPAAKPTMARSKRSRCLMELHDLGASETECARPSAFGDAPPCRRQRLEDDMEEDASPFAAPRAATPPLPAPSACPAEGAPRRRVVRLVRAPRAEAEAEAAVVPWRCESLESDDSCLSGLGDLGLALDEAWALEVGNLRCVPECPPECGTPPPPRW